MRYDNEQPLSITATPNSTAPRSFWEAISIPSTADFPPDKTYLSEVVIDNFEIEDGNLSLNTGTLTTQVNVPVMLDSSTILRTNADRPIFAGITGDEITSLAVMLRFDMRKAFDPTCRLDLYNGRDGSVVTLVLRSDRSLAITAFGKLLEIELPEFLVETDDSETLRTHVFMYALDTKLLDMPPIKPGYKANYRLSGRFSTPDKSHTLFSHNLVTLHDTRYMFEVKQDVTA